MAGQAAVGVLCRRVGDLRSQSCLQLGVAAAAQHSRPGVEERVVLTGVGLVAGTALAVQHRLMAGASRRLRRFDVMAVGTQNALAFHQQACGFGGVESSCNAWEISSERLILIPLSIKVFKETLDRKPSKNWNGVDVLQLAEF